MTVVRRIDRCRSALENTELLVTHLEQSGQLFTVLWIEELARVRVLLDSVTEGTHKNRSKQTDDADDRNSGRCMAIARTRIIAQDRKQHDKCGNKRNDD